MRPPPDSSGLQGSRAPTGLQQRASDGRAPEKAGPASGQRERRLGDHLVALRELRITANHCANGCSRLRMAPSSQCLCSLCGAHHAAKVGRAMRVEWHGVQGCGWPISSHGRRAWFVPGYWQRAFHLLSLLLVLSSLVQFLGAQWCGSGAVWRRGVAASEVDCPHCPPTAPTETGDRGGRQAVGIGRWPSHSRTTQSTAMAQLDADQATSSTSG